MKKKEKLMEIRILQSKEFKVKSSDFTELTGKENMGKNDFFNFLIEFQ